MKQYRDDWAKAKSRAMLSEIIRSTLLKFRKAKDSRVLFFPGIDAAELHEVYRPLGFMKPNIIGIERDTQVADILESKNLDFTLVRKDVVNYVNESDYLLLDVISIDYNGPISIPQVKTLNKIVQKQKRNHFVLHCANLLRRDQDSVPFYYYGHALDDVTEPSDTDPIAHYFSERSEGVFDRCDVMSRKIFEKESIGEEKLTAYTTILKTCLFGMGEEAGNQVLRFVAGDRYDDLIRQCELRSENLLGREVKLDPDNAYGSFVGHPVIQTVVEDTMWPCFQVGCQEQGITNTQEQFCIYVALHDVAKAQKHYRARDVRTYTYISESGAPMIGNIYFLSYPERFMAVARDIARMVGFPERFRVRHGQVQGLIKKVFELSKASNKFLSNEEIQSVYENERNRVFLGNSSKPVLTKKRAIEEFKNGLTIPDIKSKYRGWRNKPLPQWLAHYTMGTYDGADLDSGSPQDADLETITKGEAIDLLSSGIPAKEIFAAFPTSFSIPQLNSYQSHVTMGTYKRKKH